jgi:hypothetical protein
MLAAGPLHHLGTVSDQAGLDDVTATGPSRRLVLQLIAGFGRG